MNKDNKDSMKYYEIGKKIIDSALKMDNCLAQLLTMEVQKIKKNLKADPSAKELEMSNILLKNIIYAMMLTEEKITYGIELCRIKEEKQ